ncbi:Uncharacterised protein [uncultured archaeon]|nr:Uncharacterised protein [uncultured archaeon]
MIHTAKLRQLILPAILILAAFTAYIPHIGYPYPLHVDEWFHITVAEEVIHNNAVDLYSGQPFRLGMERAWHLMLAGIFLIFPPLKVYPFLVAALFILATLSVYTFAKRYGERIALIAAFLTALIPSNVTIGGPSLLVPVNLSLIFTPLALKFAFDKKPNLLVVFLCTLFLLYAHPPSAMVLLILLGTYALLNVKEDKTRAKSLFITIFAAVIASVPNYAGRIAEKGMESATFSFWLFVEQTPLLFGYITTVFFIAGFYMLTRTKEKENWALIIALLFLLIDIFVYTRISTSFFVPYVRVFIPMMFIMSVIAAYALAKVKSNILLGVILAAILALSLQHNYETPYYHMINETEYSDMVWINENLDKNAIILADPWKARPIPTITGMRVFTVLPFGPDSKELEQNQKAIDFFRNNCTDTQFLKDNNISVIYAPVECNNQDLKRVHNNTYILENR